MKRLDDDERRARRAYRNQRQRAAARGVVFAFGYGEWRVWWGDLWPRRGRGGDRLCMGRLGDRGPYAPGNVYPTTFADNARSAWPQLRLDLEDHPALPLFRIPRWLP